MKRSQAITLGFSALVLSLAAFSGPTAQDTRVQIDTDDVRAVYANFSRVTGTTEEVIIDFGLNTQPTGVPSQPIKIDSRLVLNFYTAKRLMGVLQLTVDRHEKAFGPIEIDVKKRVLKPTSVTPPAAPGGNRSPQTPQALSSET